MRINNNIPSTPINGADGGKRPDRTDPSRSAKADQVQLSSIAQTGAETQSQKIENLRMRVMNGTYHVSADEIAGSMIDEMMR